MKSAVVVFPGSNADRDLAVALEMVSGQKPIMVWHGDSELPDVDFIGIPGGFAYGDYLRAGAMAARSPIMADVIKKAEAGVPTYGVCNGFQVLTETGLLPGALMRNAGLKFICRDVTLRVERDDTLFTNAYKKGDVVRHNISHHDGNYFADEATLDALEGEGRVVFRYVDANGEATPESNPNGSQRNIAGIMNKRGNILGMMPHPERVCEPAHGHDEGYGLFKSIIDGLNAA